jgi:uncharacterized membrane protein YphA (DoxX/SURF4 family)
MTKDNSCAQIRTITRIVAFCCLAGMLLSNQLWLEERNFPTSPLISLINLRHPFDLILPGLAGLFLVCAGIFRNPQKCIIVFLVIAFILAFLDLNRWQPWFYQYMLMFFILSFFNYRCDDSRKQEIIITTFKLMIAAVYFWSGLQKLNPNFLSDTFPWLMEPITSRIGEGSLENFKMLGYAFPVIETLTGIFLLIPGLQRPAVISATLMHVFILFVLSPFGHNYNYVVWPWNIAMILIVFVLFYKEPSFNFRKIRNTFHFYPSLIVTILFVLMPLFNFFNSWDSYLSHNLYSGNTSNGVIIVSEQMKNKLPAHIQQYAFPDENEFQINIKYWCMKELKVPPYPEKRNFAAVTNTLFSFTKDSTEIYLYYTPKIKIME